jgi:D-serine deaminase-like pyridoxal phosphate-dependent protein
MPHQPTKLTYCVVKDGAGWRWELKDIHGVLVIAGTAETVEKARADAMGAGLTFPVLIELDHAEDKQPVRTHN